MAAPCNIPTRERHSGRLVPAEDRFSRRFVARSGQ
jgi:hypothetical protein